MIGQRYRFHELSTEHLAEHPDDDRLLTIAEIAHARGRSAELMNRTRRTIGLAGAAVLAGAAAMHVYWLAGGRTGSTRVIPTVDERPTFRPSPLATAGVAVALTTAAALYAGSTLGARPRCLHRTGTLGAAAVLAARALGDRRRVGFLKTDRDSAFARLDTAVLSPLCAALAVAGIAAAA